MSELSKSGLFKIINLDSCFDLLMLHLLPFHGWSLRWSSMAFSALAWFPYYDSWLYFNLLSKHAALANVGMKVNLNVYCSLPLRLKTYRSRLKPVKLVRRPRSMCHWLWRKMIFLKWLQKWQTFRSQRWATNSIDSIRIYWTLSYNGFKIIAC